MLEKLSPQFSGSVKSYAGWAAIGFLIAALFSTIVARNFAIPLGFYASALSLAIFKYFDEIKAFDFWSFDEWIRARRDAWDVSTWHAPQYAAESFCNPATVRARSDAAAEMNTIMMEIIRQTNSPQTGTLDFSRKIADVNSERNARYETAQLRLNQANSLLSRELQFYLARGDLMAKGLPTIDDSGRAESIIPTARWRVMTLDITKAHASGLGWRYAGIVIGRKPRPAKSPNKETAARPSEPDRDTQNAPPKNAAQNDPGNGARVPPRSRS